MTIEILNQESELQSFPIKQSIFLNFDELPEYSLLKDNIILFKLQSESELIKLSEPYSYTLGYIKETFDIVDMKYVIEPNDLKYKVICTPVNALNLQAKYCLFVSKELSDKFITIVKSVSKSKSNISVSPYNTSNSVSKTYELIITNTSQLINGKNLLKFTINGSDPYTLDIRDKSSFKYEDIVINFEDTIYVSNEIFEIYVENRTTLVKDLQYVFQTTSSSSIDPIPLEQSSTSISNSDILNFYQNLNNQARVESVKIYPEYIDKDMFFIKLPDGYKIDLDEDIIGDIRIAFNNYILESLKLYDSSLKYVCTIYIDEFENEVIFELTYSKDSTQTDTVIFNLDNLE